MHNIRSSHPVGRDDSARRKNPGRLRTSAPTVMPPTNDTLRRGRCPQRPASGHMGPPPCHSVATGGKRIAAPVCGLARNDRARCKIPSILPAHPSGIARKNTYFGNYGESLSKIAAPRAEKRAKKQARHQGRTCLCFVPYFFRPSAQTAYLSVFALQSSMLSPLARI